MLRIMTMVMVTVLSLPTLSQEVPPDTDYNFSDRPHDRQPRRIGTSEPTLMDRANSGFDLNVVLKGIYLRQLYSRLSSASPDDRASAHLQFGLSESQGNSVVTRVSDWMRYTAAHANDQKAQMCSFWRSDDGSGISSDQRAESALQIWESLEISDAEKDFQIDIVMNLIEQDLGSDVRNNLVDIYETRKASFVSAMAWPDGVRARGNSVYELDFVCGEAK